MKKASLIIILLGFTIPINAQWNTNGNNSTTGKVTANDILVNNLHLAYGNMSSNWSQYNHLKDKMFIYTNSSSKGMFFSSYGQGADIRFQTGNGWDDRPYASLLLSNNGNIGIGTISPTQKLEVKGNILLKSDSYVHYAIERGNGAKSVFGIISNTHDGFISSSGNLKFLTNNNGTNYLTSMFINSTGNIGIGTTNPNGWKLAVNGKIRAKEIKVETGWSDFVFYDNYKLPTLSEVENHIKEKGHLKGIPSAKEVEKNGILLGEMDSKLLQKIEELTLYTIQQEKQLNKQSKEILELKILMEKLLESKK
ncbi:hypothetical protein D1816_02390 [Aquimarina sp. AD10]|uniref:hypothetical protein n=1 Tax=Aquimarina sp. AD10 TaxID=1714849 RepID=UPI000E4C7F02|nr:hypothetical protein [Aquimarina sp. AD10]AXT59243.1 hypothetical protein D1816_02390 [Aquimarina sp. AD10]RKM91331.1 hypothetical protein D7033_22235 [Aquimarina sp. AD10]